MPGSGFCAKIHCQLWCRELWGCSVGRVPAFLAQNSHETALLEGVDPLVRFLYTKLGRNRVSKLVSVLCAPISGSPKGGVCPDYGQSGYRGARRYPTFMPDPQSGHGSSQKTERAICECVSSGGFAPTTQTVVIPLSFGRIRGRFGGLA